MTNADFEDLIRGAHLESDIVSPDGLWRVQKWAKLEELVYPFDLMDKTEKWILIKRMTRLDNENPCVKIYTQKVQIGNWKRDPSLSDYIESF